MSSDRDDMVRRVLVGPTGGKISVWDNKGVYLPGFPNTPRSYDDFKDVKARDDDIFICTYPRSGLHWTWEITRMLKLGKTDTMENMIMEQSMIEFNKLDAVDKMVSPRVFPTHMTFTQLPPSFKEKKCKIIYITRDPRAVAVSFFRLFSSFNAESGLMFEGDWEDFLPMFMDEQLPLNGWFEMQKNWEKTIQENPDYPVYLLYFENLKQDTVGEIMKIAKFLEVDASEQFCHSVASSVDFNKMKKSKETAGEDSFVSKWFKEKQYSMLRKGTVDDWKYIFTVAQHEQFLETFKKKMKESSYTLRS